jgi:hypothetical protein
MDAMEAAAFRGLGELGFVKYELRDSGSGGKSARGGASGGGSGSGRGSANDAPLLGTKFVLENQDEAVKRAVSRPWLTYPEC